MTKNYDNNKMKKIYNTIIHPTLRIFKSSHKYTDIFIFLQVEEKIFIPYSSPASSLITTKNRILLLVRELGRLGGNEILLSCS